MDAKVCSKCNIPKDESEFRERVDKRVSPPRVSLNPTCKVCDILLAKEYYDKHKNNIHFKEKNRVRAKRYINSNNEEIIKRRKGQSYKKKHSEWALNRYYRKKDEINAKLKEKRKKPEYKDYVKEYSIKNKDRILELGRQRNKRYIQKMITENPDKYALNKLVEQIGISKDELLSHPEIIEAKKLILNLKRKIKNND